MAKKKIAPVEETADKQAPAPTPASTKPLNFPVDEYLLHRDTFVKGIDNVQEQLAELKNFFINNTNKVLADAGVDALRIVAANSALDSAAKAVGAKDEKDEKKGKVKRQHDPNAPKRPLTAYFLYMETARPIIANDLGPDVARGDVSLEGTKRWNLLDQEAKDLWTKAYQANLRLYKARVHSYKFGNNPNAQHMTDEEAMHYAETHEIEGMDPHPSAQLVSEAHKAVQAEEDEDAEGEPDKEPTPPPVAKATPKPKSSRKKAKAEPIVPSSAGASTSGPVPIAPAPEPTPTVAAKAEKRKRAKKPEPADAAPEDVADATPVKAAPKSRKKAKKADA